MRRALFAAFAVVCMFALIWPGYAWFGARAEPFILGLPFSLTWNVIWLAASFGALLAYHWTAPKS